MFGLGFTEILVILIIIIVAVKPEELPGVMKKFGKSYGEVKKTCSEVNKIKDDFVKLADADIETLIMEQPKTARNNAATDKSIDKIKYHTKDIKVEQTEDKAEVKTETKVAS